MKHYLAIDLGATSGRTIVGTLDKGRINLEELTRFDNPLIALGTSRSSATTARCSAILSPTATRTPTA